MRIAKNINEEGNSTYGIDLQMGIIVADNSSYEGVQYGMANNELIFKFAGSNEIDGTLICDFS